MNILCPLTFFFLINNCIPERDKEREREDEEERERENEREKKGGIGCCETILLNRINVT